MQIQQFLLQSQDIFSDQYHTDKHPRHDQERSESDCRYEAADYSDLDFDRQAIAGYDTIYLYAWSMGVWGASSVLENADITMAFAVNGTPFPADDARGIPVGIFQGTAERLDERNLLKFRKRILGSSDASMLSLISQGSASVAELKEELGAILRMSPSIKSDSIRWRRAYIGNDDRIFPAENQVNAWNEISARAGV